MTTTVHFSTNTYGDSPDGTIRQDINAPIFKVATEKKPSNDDQGRRHWAGNVCKHPRHHRGRFLPLCNQMITKRTIKASQKMGNLVKMGATTTIKDWRPIVLHNTDYKILTRENADSLRPTLASSTAAFLNRRAATRYRALASIIPGRKRFSWNLSF